MGARALQFGVLALVLGVVGLPVCELFRYSLLIGAAIAVCAGTVTSNPKPWLAATAAGVVVAAVLALWPAPRIDEGYNFYFANPGMAASLRLPPEVANVLEAQFDSEYAPRDHCDPADRNCCRRGSFPTPRGFAFSADAIYQRPAMSRSVLGIDFSDPVQLRLGDINNTEYNNSDRRYCTAIHRFDRDRKSLNLLDRFRLQFPLFLAYRFPAAFTGSRLCWRGWVLWPRDESRFDAISHEQWDCRTLGASDIGRTIYAVSIRRDARLGMRLEANIQTQVHRWTERGVLLGGVLAIVLLLVHVERRRLRLPVCLMALTLMWVAAVDWTFIGGLRPLDDADDGMTYEGMGRAIVQHLLAGDFSLALRGEESVYFFTPGLRYFRAAERFLFGDTYLGYLTLILILPLLVLAVARRFLPERWALAMALGFVATPLGALFGSGLFEYVVWAARGFADPIAYIFLFAGIILIVPKREDRDHPRVWPAFWGALALAAATFCRPNLVLASGAMVAGANVLAWHQRRIGRIAALLVGFAALGLSPLHNYVFGHSPLPFSDNVYDPRTMVTTPRDYWRAIEELLHLDLGGQHVLAVLRQQVRWLSGASSMAAMVPIHAAAIAALVRVGVFGRKFDPWVRLLALAMLLQQAIGLFYVDAARYYLGVWLLTAVVFAGWIRGKGLPLFDRFSPGTRVEWARASWGLRLESWFGRVERMLGGAEPARRIASP